MSKLRPLSDKHCKPKEPKEPRPQDFPRECSVTNKSPFVVAHHKYNKDLAKYHQELELYEQTKLIRLVKNADMKYILKKYKIVKL